MIYCSSESESDTGLQGDDLSPVKLHVVRNFTSWWLVTNKVCTLICSANSTALEYDKDYWYVVEILCNDYNKMNKDDITLSAWILVIWVVYLFTFYS